MGRFVSEQLSHPVVTSFQRVADRLGVRLDQLVSGGVAIVILLATIVWFVRSKSFSAQSSSSSSKQESINKNHAASVKSIWDFNRKNRAASTAKSKDGSNHSSNSSGKPFGSTYYYAHNNPNATGGYRDGLRMEDYTMNQPRLLSRDGKPVEEAAESESVEGAGTVPEQQPLLKPTKGTAVVPVRDPSVKLITKYQWDDPGDYNGIAHIRIDTLPGKSDTDNIPWQDITVKEISAKLIGGGGLEVKVHAESGETYLLHIPTLYGQAAAVRAFIKPKRLVVRLWKVKGMFSVLDYGTSNLKPWPQLRKS